jgi:hypothetical protein
MSVSNINTSGARNTSVRELNFVCFFHKVVKYIQSRFGDLEVACWLLVPKFAGSHPAEVVGFLGRKNPQHAFLRRGSKAVGPMS